MRISYLFLCIMFSVTAFSQGISDSIINSIKIEQNKLVKFYLDSTTSPLSKQERKAFEGIKHFSIDLNYRVEAKLEKFASVDTVIFPTSSGRNKMYLKYANVTFEIEGKKHSLVIYKMAGVKNPEYANLLFLPFTDLTSNFETYGGGRYIDLLIPEGDTMIIDFNLCYHPYCAYSHNGWSCPIPPKENFVNTKIKAGVKN